MRKLLFLIVPIIILSAGVSSGESKYKSAPKPSPYNKQVSTNIYGESEIRSLIAGNGDFSSYNRLSGLINDIFREQKLLFMKNNQDKNNSVSKDASDLINEAALYASEDNYKDSFSRLGKAFDILAVSVSNLQSK